MQLYVGGAVGITGEDMKKALVLNVDDKDEKLYWSDISYSPVHSTTIPFSVSSVASLRQKGYDLCITGKVSRIYAVR
jgi:hypothetical protein